MPIAAALRELKTRTRQIVKLLRPIRPGADVGCTIVPGPQQASLGLCAHEGGEYVPVRRYREMRFRTRAQGLWAQYFEIWRERPGQDRLALEQICLNVYSVRSASDVLHPLVSIHSEPTDTSDMKKGPHLHVVQAEDPLPHCHFPLDYGRLDGVLKSAQSLTDALRNAVTILDKEVVARF